MKWVRSGYQKEIKRERRLPMLGEVLVNEGQLVELSEVIARAELLDKILVVNLAERLGINPDEVEDCLVRKPGESLLEDDVIAWIEGTIPRLVRAPIDGVFAALHQGCAIFEADKRVIEVCAEMHGVVESIIPGFGATLVTSGLLLQGVWGNEKVGAGRLRVLPLSWFEPLEKSMISSIAPDEIIVIGQSPMGSELERVLTQNPSGLILGSINPKLIKMILGLDIPVLVLGGFGTFEPDSLILELLQPLDGGLTNLNAKMDCQEKGSYPEAIISVERNELGKELELNRVLSIGQRVRLLSGKHAGELGETTELLDEPHRFESGLDLEAAVVNLANGKKVTVARQNLLMIT